MTFSHALRGVFYCLLLSGTAFGQGVRFDWRVLTVASNVPVGASAPLLAVPNATVTICNDGNCLLAAAVIYSDQALTVPTSNPLNTDGQGRFGFWTLAGTYFYKVVLPSGTVQGIYPFTLGGSGGSGGINQLSGDVFAGPTTGFANATLGTVNASPGTCGDSTHSCQITTDLKGRTVAQAQVTIGNATSASALAATPSLCSAGFAPIGVLANGNATGCAPIGAGGLSGQTPGRLPLANSTTTSTSSSAIADSGTAVTISEPTTINDGTGKAGNVGFVAGTAPSAAPASTVQINAPAAVTAYAINLPGAQPTAGNPALNCTAANPSICSWAASGGGILTGYGGVNTFGDSITDGTGSSTLRQGGGGAMGYAWKILNAYGANGTNYAYGGDQAGDMAVKINNITPQLSDNFLTTMMISTNDNSVYGTNTTLQGIFTIALDYSIAYASIPDVAKLHFANGSTPTPNANCTFTTPTAWLPLTRAGFVISSMQLTGAGSDGSNATCSFTTYGSGPIYLAYSIYGGWAHTSTMNVTVDGGSVISFSTSPSVSFTTANGQVLFPVLARLPGPYTAGVHSVSITLAGGGSGDDMELWWLGAPLPPSQYVALGGDGNAPPDVFVGGTPWEQSNAGQPGVGQYNTIITNEVSTFAGDGLPVHFVPVQSYLNSTTDFSGGTLTNGVICPASTLNPLHPGDCGHAHLAQAFLTSMPASNFSGSLPALTYYGPIRTNSGGGGWVSGTTNAWQVGTSVGFSGTAAGGCTFAGGIITAGCSGGGGAVPLNITSSVTVSGCAVSGNKCVVGTPGATVIFSGIPGTYSKIVVEGVARCSASAGQDTVYLQFNGDTGTNYDMQYGAISSGTNIAAAANVTAKPGFAVMACATALAGASGNFSVNINGYANTAFLKFSATEGGAGIDTTFSASTFLQENHTIIAWNNTAAITSVLLGVVGGSNFAAGSTFTIYGIP